MKRLFVPAALLLLALAVSSFLGYLYPHLFAASSAREQVEGTAPAGWNYMYGLEWSLAVCNVVIIIPAAWLIVRTVKLIESINKGKINE